MGITKTDFVRGLQCPKMLWLDKHRPQEKVIPPEIRERLDKGNEFGDEMMGIFGEYEETTAFKPDGSLDFKRMLERTKECLEERVSVICEAAFLWYGNYCAADILRLTSDGYEIYEVKNSDKLKEQFITDAAFQYYIIKKCGVRVAKSYILLNDGGAPFFSDVTNEVKSRYRFVNDNIFKLNSVKFAKEEPIVSCGEQCDNPYECWYKGYCASQEKR